MKKHENSSSWPKLCNFFEQTTMFRCFDELFSKRLQKVAQFVKKQEKSSIWPKLCNFSNKLPCLCISINFSRKSCKNALFREKPREIIDSAKTLQLFEQTTMSLHFDELFRKKLQKVPHFVRKYEKSSIWPKLATFQEKVAKSASFREDARETIDLAKTFNFSSKLPCLGIFINFSARMCRNCLIPWKSTGNHRFGQNYATFSNKLPCLCISINFSGKSCKKWLIS